MDGSDMRTPTETNLATDTSLTADEVENCNENGEETILDDIDARIASNQSHAHMFSNSLEQRSHYLQDFQ